LLGEDPCGLVSTAEMEYEISVYPNPSNGQINIKGISSLDSKVDIQVFDIQGNLILQTQNVDIINLGNQAEGLYFVTISIDNQEVLIKKISLIK
jgi:hypothetical protein